MNAPIISMHLISLYQRERNLRLPLKIHLQDVHDLHRSYFISGTRDKLHPWMAQQIAVNSKGIIGKMFQAALKAAPFPDERVVLQGDDSGSVSGVFVSSSISGQWKGRFRFR